MARPAGKKAKAAAADGPTCFVIIGFGVKTDFTTGRVLDLDKTYTRLIKPACDRLGVRCFRAIDVNRSGSIDEVMYRWIYAADLVIADLSTLNANVFYELGVRHAQKPFTTLVIAESEMLKRLPFDLGHTVIHAYEHLGEEIHAAETARFVDHLATLLHALIAAPGERDSPVFTYLRGMKPPAWEDVEQRLERLEAQRAGSEPTLAALVEKAEQAKRSGDFAAAIALFSEAVARQSDDVFLRQRLALVTYKEKDKAQDAEEALRALTRAWQILSECSPGDTNDPETLGLAGAIHKRFFERTGEPHYLDDAIGYYERGFYVKQDYYNGINAAYLYNLKANLATNDFDAVVCYGYAQLIRQRVADVCRAAIASKSFDYRGDKVWIYQTLAQAYLGMGREADCAELLPRIEELSEGSFDMDTFKRQNEGLLNALAAFQERFGDLAGAGAAALHQTLATPAPPVPGAVATHTLHPPARHGGDPIVIDVGREPGKSIKSIEIQCKVEYG